MMARVIRVLLLMVIVQISFGQQKKDSSFSSASADTLWRKDPAFSYMSNLDSMLQEKNSQKEEDRVTFLNHRSQQPGFMKLFENPVVNILFWIAAIVFVLYIIYSLFFRFKIFEKTSKSADTSHITEEKELSQFDEYMESIQKAESDKNYRLSVRYLFLAALSSLQEKQVIQFHPEKTNYEYISEIGEPAIKSGFANLARIFEYVWYGKNSLTEENYFRIKNYFTGFYKILSN